MTNRTWIGGRNSNDAGAAANWSPTGAPQPGDDLTVVQGTLEIGRNSLANDILHVNDPLISGGDPSGNGAPVTLDMNGNGATARIDGELFFGDPLTINARGLDFIDATGGFGAITGNINLADHAHLFMTGGIMQFAYGGSINGGVGTTLTNYGRIDMTQGHVSTLVNGDGTLVFHGYHNGPGYAEISAPVTMAQTVELNGRLNPIQLTLSDPGDFHAMLKIDNRASVVVKGIQANGFVAYNDLLLLTNAGRVVDALRVPDLRNTSVTATYGQDTTLSLVSHTTS